MCTGAFTFAFALLQLRLRLRLRVGVVVKGGMQAHVTAMVCRPVPPPYSIQWQPAPHGRDEDEDGGFWTVEFRRGHTCIAMLSPQAEICTSWPVRGDDHVAVASRVKARPLVTTWEAA